METWCQGPLNLVKNESVKSKPVAIVAPSSIKQDSTEEAPLKNSEKYQIDRLLEPDHTRETGYPQFYSMIHNLAATEQSLLTAIYMRNLMGMTQSPFFNTYDTLLYENYKKYLEKSKDPYPTLREQLNSSTADEELGEAQKRLREIAGIGIKEEQNISEHEELEEPLNLRIKNEVDDDVPLDFSKKSFSLQPNQSLSLKCPEYESLSKPLVLAIPNPSERSLHKKKESSGRRRKRSSSLDHKTSSGHGQDSKQDSGSQNDKKKPHIKKPLNAFMLYMKEMRAKVVAECTLKESAAINQILGRRWHALGREEQAKYYEMARRERQLHMQLYPDWSSRANSSRGKKRKRKQEANDGGNNMKKCRARYGLDQQSQWCKPCRRKKKCIRYLETGEIGGDGNQSEDNLGSCGSVGEAQTPPDDDDGAESLPHSLSSPGGLSGLSSLTSPGMILPSPSTSLASPSVSLASPLTPPTYDLKPLPLPPLHRNPVGTNPHDVNNPLSVNQLTGKCIKNEPKEHNRPISVT